jgi:hypothetical protein
MDAWVRLHTGQAKYFLASTLPLGNGRSGTWITNAALRRTNYWIIALDRNTFTVKFKPPKRRAEELFKHDTPYGHRVERDRKRDATACKPKHRNAWRDEL